MEKIQPYSETVMMYIKKKVQPMFCFVYILHNDLEIVNFGRKLVEVKPRFHSFCAFEEYAKMIAISYSLRILRTLLKHQLPGFRHLKKNKKTSTKLFPYRRHQQDITRKFHG
jgi:hypothetical protein